MNIIASPLGAAASNAGDEFHELWALREVLRLLDPSTALSGVQVQGVRTERPADSEGPQWDGVDCTLYYGGLTIENADRIEIVQLKYSVTNPDMKWTLSRICQSKSKAKNNSIARKLGQLFMEVKALRGSNDIESSFAFGLISNQPIHPDLVKLIFEHSSGGEFDEDAEKLRKAAGLTKAELSLFLSRLQLKRRRERPGIS